MEIKYCSCCLVGLPISCFYKDSAYKDGYRGECKSCRRVKQMEYSRRVGRRGKSDIKNKAVRARGRSYERQWNRGLMLKNKYGITLEEFEQMSAAQGHKCAICDYPAEKMFHKALYVDHCHKTKTVRGLLCWRCNTMLGRIGDDIAGVTRLLKYVSRGA